ncbi:phospholysine phosphohistidine inorganic pyrophosphate phosphatase isoform X2 [Agelaius tricolor]|uniref:phospholysine phosphohistidine inorganic pyrophosphate phosphatase isoform X2 n=1 Tax=Agelaius tricolor TaxID=9191 RepID=UPI0039F2526B
MAERGRGWARAVRGLLLDVSGVLYDSGAGGGVPIAGSVEAVRRIKASGLKLQLCTNETQATRQSFVRKLRALGFDISVAQVTAPAPAACHLLRERGLRPHLLVHHDLVPEFAEIDKTNPNCVVLGDAAENFTYANLNEAFRLLIGMEKPVLLSLGKGMLVISRLRWWGNHQKGFLSQPWQNWEFQQSRPSDENHPEVKPDAYVNNLAEAVDIILQEL